MYETTRLPFDDRGFDVGSNSPAARPVCTRRGDQLMGNCKSAALALGDVGVKKSELLSPADQC